VTKSRVVRNGIEYIDMEPNWAGLRRWALNGSATTTHSPQQRRVFRQILIECDKAQQAGRPYTNWSDSDDS
jgi:hypothetical protein